MSKVTIVKNYRNTVTLKTMGLEEVVNSILTCEYDEAVSLARHTARDTSKLPRVCFATEMENRNHLRVRKSYSGLVLLEVNNLQSYDEAVAVRQGAGLMPQTLLAFVGASGLSVKIVCQGELFEGNGLPTEEEEIARFHLNLYEKARLAYNAQLGVTIDKLEPTLDRTCYLSADSGLVWNPTAVPFYTDTSNLEHALRPLKPKDTTPDEIVPGRSRYHSMQLIYEYCLSKAYDDVAGETDPDDYNHLLLTRLAGYCLESGLEMAFAQRQALFNSLFFKEADVVRKVFENVYRPEHERQYRQRMNIPRPLKHIPTETLMTMKIDIFLNTNYELRKNVMRGVAEYRQRTGLGFSFQDLTEEARNSITIRALSQGIKCWDKDIRR